jgi:hypothetical protein
MNDSYRREPAAVLREFDVDAAVGSWSPRIFFCTIAETAVVFGSMVESLTQKNHASKRQRIRCTHLIW